MREENRVPSRGEDSDGDDTNMIRTNKPDAAWRQCDGAIRMLLQGEDPLAVATVACAAFRLVRDLSQKKGNGRVWNTIYALTKPGMQSEVWKAFNKVPDFHSE